MREIEEVSPESGYPVEKPEESVPSVSVLDLPMAKLQIMQAGDMVRDGYLVRSDVDPILDQNADGLWMLTLRRQGKHGKFSIPYIGSEVLLADAEMGFIVVLVAYHGTETFGRKKNKRVSKGQFYRFYRQAESGGWHRLIWRQLNDGTRQMVLDLDKPEWARKPGKLSSERNPPAKPVIMTSYKVVRLINGRYFSLYQPDQEYILGQRVKQRAKPGHQGGFFSYPTNEAGLNYLESCVRVLPFHDDIDTPELALIECEIGGRIINYGHKMASTYLCPLRVLEVRQRS